MNILGISAFYHDSAAVLLRDGKLVAAAQEERFSRKKHDAGFPLQAMKYCLAEGEIAPGDLGAVAFYDKPITKFARILETYFGVAPKGLSSFMIAIPLWLRKKLWIPLEIEKSLEQCGFKDDVALFFPEHHESHAASAFFPSPYDSAAILTMDGVGEWATTTLGRGQGNRIELIEKLHFPHSLGLLYSAFTYFTGFKVNSGEYKLMGLAPYGQPSYVNTIYDHLIDLKEDGSFRLNMDYFGYLDSLTMTNQRFSDLFGAPPRKPETEITRREMDLACSIQKVTEEIAMRMARHLYDITGEKNLCLAGGVALNCVSNGNLLRNGPFENIWIQPAAGDAGGALGAAQMVWHHIQDNPRTTNGLSDSMQGSYLGPSFSTDEIKSWLDAKGYAYREMTEAERADTIARLIDEQNIIGLFQGRMEYGPRALGNRSIIGDARSPDMQSIMNRKIKYRESFRPFAPSCLNENVTDFFEMERPSPYMLLTVPVKKTRRRIIDNQETAMRDRIHQIRSDIPAVTHVDYSARVQTVTREDNQLYYDIIKAFEKRTGYGIIINTSFNVRGDPIVCTPEDAYRCFMRTQMDYLVLENLLLSKEEQPE